VHQDVSQEDFFLKELKNSMGQKSHLVITYGVRDSGKTYTVFGTRTDPGLVPRALNFLFAGKKGSNTSIQFKTNDFNIILKLSNFNNHAEMSLKKKLISGPNSSKHFFEKLSNYPPINMCNL